MATNPSHNPAADEFPDGTIVLLDGTQLPCYPLAEQPSAVVPDKLSLDTTGTYLSVGRRKPKAIPAPDEDTLSERDFFLKYAFFFFRNADRILADSRMYLAPVPIQNVLAYFGPSGFRSPTLGIYIEWWINNFDAIGYDMEGHEALVFHLAGSPLSGCNNCSCVLPDGTIYRITLTNFCKMWRSFMAINQRYTAAKQRYQAYTLGEVADLLGQAGCTSEKRPEIAVLIQTGRLKALKHELEESRRQQAEAEEEHYRLVVAHHKEALDDLLARYQALRTHTEEECEKIDEQCSMLRRKLKSGLINGKIYQKSLRPLKEQREAIVSRLTYLETQGIRKITESSPFINSNHVKQYLKEQKDAQRNSSPEEDQLPVPET